MKIRCTCENIIVDQTDNLKNKGYIIPDTDWIEFWDLIDGEIKKSTPPIDEFDSIQLRMQNYFKTLWECEVCGRLYISGEDNKLLEYAPENKMYNKALSKK
jgi:hypothetical protein